MTVGLVLLLVATACSSSSSSAGTQTASGSASNSSDAASADTDQTGNDQTGTGQTDNAGTGTAGNDTNTDSGSAAADPDGGATSAAADAVVVQDADAVRALLDPGVARASGSWPTDWSRTTVDVSEIRAGLGGSDPRDGIPPIDFPEYQSISEAAEWVADNEPGALVQLDDEAWFFPLSIMTSHEIVNDELGGIPVAVTYCPLCNTAITFDRRVDGEVLRFGVSGLLRKSDLVMWDDQTTSLWQQITGEGIVGTHAGVNLEVVSTAIVSFGQFAEGFPNGLSLSPNTGFGRDYGFNPYVRYSSSDAPIGGFFLDDPDPRLPALSRVVGVVDGDEARAYSFLDLAVSRVVNDTLAGTDLVVLWGGDTADALDSGRIADGIAIGSAIAYDRTVDGRVLTFEADGDGFRDLETGSVWNVLGQATDGDLAGTRLSTVPHRNEFWFAFAGFFPDADIHSR